MKTKISGKTWCAITMFSLIGQIAWVVENMYLNVFIYKMFHASASDISLMVAASAVAATLTTVFIGALSDKIGKRKLFMCGGYILWGISILGFVLVREDILSPLLPATVSVATAGVSLVIILDCLMTFFGSSANDAAFNAWLTDITDESNRGAAEGINAMMPLVAILAVFGGFMAFDLNLANSWSIIFAIIGGIVILIGILGIFLIKETPLTPAPQSYWRTLIHGFLLSTVKKSPQLYLSLFSFILFNISIQIFMPYLIIYYEVSLGMKDYVFVMAPAIILASVATAFWGKVYDKKGVRFSGIISLITLCVGYVLLYFFQATLPVFIGSLLMMCGYLCGMAVFGAKIRNEIPLGKAGMFQGVRIFSQVLIPGMVGPFIGKLVLSNAQTVTNNDGTTSFIPNGNIFLSALAVALLTLIVLILTLKKEPPHLCKDLKTPFEQDTSTSWNDYPRPQMKRDSYLPLSESWSLFIKKNGTETSVGTIQVPFPPESRLSGIERELENGEHWIYRKSFTLPDSFLSDRVLLHLGAVDQKAWVYLNGKQIGAHGGGYLPFTVDLTDALLDGENQLCIEVEDELDLDLPYGKQTKKRGGMWYTPISGIWQPVWLESVPTNYIHSIRVTPTLNSVTIETIGGLSSKTVRIQTENGVLERSYEGDSVTIELPSPILWTPEHPHLYPFTLTDGTDTVDSYFALRTVEIVSKNGKPYICLNGQPTFFHGLLDQGYYSDGIYLPATPQGYRFDIQRMKELGFNMLRKHIKIEPDCFYYFCDRYGMLVFQDMVNSGKYHYLLDTILPTIGKKRGISHSATKERRTQFEQDAKETVSLLYNHPSVIYYTVFNEGWGQYDADHIYKELKSTDPTRVWDATSGWFAERESDVVSEHIYFKKINLKSQSQRPLVLSEFGGYSYKIPEHSFNLDQTYGYRFYNSKEAFEKALLSLYRDEIIPCIKKSGLCAAVLTQVSDVEDETNGLLTYDRQVLKVEPEAMKALSEEIYSAFDEQVR